MHAKEHYKWYRYYISIFTTIIYYGFFIFWMNLS